MVLLSTVRGRCVLRKDGINLNGDGLFLRLFFLSWFGVGVLGFLGHVGYLLLIILELIVRIAVLVVSAGYLPRYMQMN